MTDPAETTTAPPAPTMPASGALPAPGVMDAARWADAYLAAHPGVVDAPDHATLQTWFAGALQSGWEKGYASALDANRSAEELAAEIVGVAIAQRIAPGARYIVTIPRALPRTAVEKLHTAFVAAFAGIRSQVFILTGASVQPAPAVEPDGAVAAVVHGAVTTSQTAFQAAHLAGLAIQGARNDPAPDKTDWIRMWAAARAMCGLPSDDPAAWERAYMGSEEATP